MNATRLDIPDLVLLEPRVFEDARGHFFESFNQRQLDKLLGFSVQFVQDNHSLSAQHVIRGLHYQRHCPQAKLVRVVSGVVFDVAVDLRRSSSHFGRWFSVVLSAENKKQLWIPEGFAHGFAVMSESAEVVYKTSDYWSAEDECCIAWDDPTLAIHWPSNIRPNVSLKDSQGVCFNKANTFL